MLLKDNVNDILDVLEMRYNKSAKQIHTNHYTLTRRLKKKHRKTDCKVYHN